MKKITAKAMREELLPQMLAAQGGRCPMCNLDMRFIDKRNVCVDHDHTTGQIRGLLCRNCNGTSGKLENLAVRSRKELTSAQWLNNVVKYLSAPRRWDYIYPTHKTPAEALIAKQKAAVKKRRKL